MLKTGNQLRAARALVGISQTKLAKKAAVNANTISAMERCGARPFKSAFETVCSVMAALESEGCEFSPESIGVTLKLSSPLGIRPSNALRPSENIS
jgi:DNA-binding XRE family transcriptional regulator